MDAILPSGDVVRASIDWYKLNAFPLAQEGDAVDRPPTLRCNCGRGFADRSIKFGGELELDRMVRH
jgi:hypothetical protein